MKEPDFSRRIDRRALNKNILKGIAAVTFLASVGSWITSAQSDDSQSPLEQPTPTAFVEKPPYSREAVTDRILDLLSASQPASDDIEKLFTGGELTSLQYVIDGRILEFYKTPCTIETSDAPGVCDVQMNLDQSVVEPLNQPFIHSSIGFSEDWYEMMTHKGQFAALTYAANIVLQTPRFNRYHYKQQVENGAPQQFQNAFLEPIYSARKGVELLQTEPYHTIHKNAPLIPILQTCEHIDHEDIDLKRDFDLIVSPEFRQHIKERGIQLHNIPSIPTEYDEFVYGLESPWVQAVMEWNGLTT